VVLNLWVVLPQLRDTKSSVCSSSELVS
jgi:hypothetical protein